MTTDTTAAPTAADAARLRAVQAQAADWAASRDLTLAAAGRIIQALLDGRTPARDLI
jgi:hypothetical protein